MDFSYERRKKSDKAKDKAGRPSSKHVRQYEALHSAHSKKVNVESKTKK